MDLTGRRVLVMGLGRSGQAAARLAVASGAAAVTGIDLREDTAAIEGVTMHLGPHPQACFDEADLLIVSPGIPTTQPQLAAAVDRGTQVMGELSFAASFLDLPMVGVTGTNGKSTVTHFTGQLLAHAGFRTFVGGNLGNPLSNAVSQASQLDRLVVEVSSYQLELARALRPQVAVILNLTPDHLERHGTMEAYAAAKARIFDGMTDEHLAVLPVTDPLLRSAARHVDARRLWLGHDSEDGGVVRRGRTAWIILPGAAPERIDLAQLSVRGSHNLDNAATAALLARAVGAPIDAVREGIGHLEALPHRMCVVSRRDGIVWIDDSKATNIDAARAGIRGLEGAAVVLLGGRGKRQPDGTLGFTALAEPLARHRGVVAFGEAGPAIADELRAAAVTCSVATTLARAVERSLQLARPGDAVLLSPGCASFDEFDDFEHRGRVFEQLAKGVAS
ncbi:MAG: UDP-N-acetylmuramoyl-L-alanine--D-glutamate ligase [Myxococcales bacterium]|nr:UDP-N-acetylmuramoyl-L-alanine--D-glutamate ligase [Myxococcales bacterium]